MTRTTTRLSPSARSTGPSTSADVGALRKLAQFFGVDLTLQQQIFVMLICILGGIGTAGVPAGSLPVVALILAGIGVPPEGIGLILGVDRLLDMCRTTLNVVGDLVAAQVISARSGEVVQ